MTVFSPRRTPGAGAGSYLCIAALCWVMATALTGLAAGAQSTADPAIGFDWTISPEALGPGSAFTLDGTITIEPDRVDAANATASTITWILTVGPVGDVTIEDSSCDTTTGTSCAAKVNAADDTVTFSGVVDTDPPANVTADVRIAGTIADQLDRDAILFEADTCGTVTVVSGTPAGRLPVGAATPDAGTSCEGTAGTIEVTVAPATEPPTELPTEEPTTTPTPEPSPTAAPTSTPTATAEPTATPTIEPSPTPEPTATETVAPTATPTSEPSPTPTTEPTVEPTEAPTATIEPTAAATATTEPTATSEPTETPTVKPTATSESTAAPTEEPTATTESTETPAVIPTAPSTAAPPPQPTPDESDANTGLWIGVGSLLVLAAAAGVVLYQRRRLTA